MPRVAGTEPVSVLQKVIGGLLAVLLIGITVVWVLTAPPSERTVTRRAVQVAAKELVDETSYSGAERLARWAATADEQSLSLSALRVADHELDVAFTQALSDVEAHPPTLGDEALKIQSRLRRSQAMMDSDQQRVTDLGAQVAQAKPAQKDALQDDLDLAKSQVELDKDEIEQSTQDLTDAGGNPRGQIEALVQAHATQAKAPHPVDPSTVAAGDGSLGRFRQWLKVHQKRGELEDARQAALAKADGLVARRSEMAEALDSSKGGISELSQHTKRAQTAAEAPAAPTPHAAHSHDEAATLLNQTLKITADQKIITLLDRRIADQHQLATLYTQWDNIGARQAQVLLHELMLNALLVTAILLAVILIDAWLRHLLNNPRLDRRQVETLRSLARVALRLIAFVVIVIIVVGVPSQFGTMIGIVGAGLTVALKDFIVAFFGWLALMGRNGIRLGDWVEINGVSGEVTELGMFHTVLLETGNWSDAGHPTGRRVTFTNSFAIERHYFNFSTSGQWLWDELQVVVPTGIDPYPIVEAITREVGEATAESSRLAEQEWQRTVTGRAQTFSAAPGVNMKPVYGGIEISVRYITRANERFAVRTKLYQSAVDLLGKRALPVDQPQPPGQPQTVY